MRKRLVSLFVAFALAFSALACSSPENAGIICSECEKVIAEGSRFCSFCGALVDASFEKEITTGTLDIENDIKFLKKIFSCEEIETLAMHYPKDITSYDDLTIDGSFANINGLYEIVLLDNGDILNVVFRWEENDSNISEKELAKVIEKTLINDGDIELSYYSEEELWFEKANDNDEKLTEDSGHIYGWDIDLDGITTLENLETRIEEHLASSITSLASRWEALSVEIDTYDKYCDNSEKVSGFYQTVITETDQMCIMLYEYSAAYARMILDSDMSADDKYDAVDGINEHLYEDACDEILDEIYEGILEDMNDYFFEGILDDAGDDVNYSDWYDVCSDEYNQWYDTYSEVYGLYYDAASEIYSFYYDMSSELYSRDYDRAEKVYNKFLQKIAKAKGTETGDSAGNATFDTTLRSAGSIEELESVIDAHVSECVQALVKEWETLSTDIGTFEKYQDNMGVIEEFHSHIEDSASQILVMICNYGASYADFILQSGSSAKDMYKAFEAFKDCIYEDACEYVKDDIYEALLEEVKEYYYEGIINDAKDSVNYSDWSDARGDAYSWWSDARGEVYGEWSDTRGDLYSFYSDIRSELYSGDIVGATDELEDFRKKYSNRATTTSNVFDGNDAESNETADAKKESDNSNSDNEIRPEFKEAMDSYEAFYTEYCEFMKKYSENPSDLMLLAKYAEMLVKAEKMSEAFEEWDEDDLNDEELKYYLDVNNRVMKMLVEAAG